jgi:hypothetical protein
MLTSCFGRAARPGQLLGSWAQGDLHGVGLLVADEDDLDGLAGWARACSVS